MWDTSGAASLSHLTGLGTDLFVRGENALVQATCGGGSATLMRA